MVVEGHLVITEPQALQAMAVTVEDSLQVLMVLPEQVETEDTAMEDPVLAETVMEGHHPLMVFPVQEVALEDSEATAMDVHPVLMALLELEEMEVLVVAQVDDLQVHMALLVVEVREDSVGQMAQVVQGHQTSTFHLVKEVRLEVQELEETAVDGHLVLMAPLVLVVVQVDLEEMEMEGHQALMVLPGRSVVVLMDSVETVVADLLVHMEFPVKEVMVKVDLEEMVLVVHLDHMVPLVLVEALMDLEEMEAEDHQAPTAFPVKEVAAPVDLEEMVVDVLQVLMVPQVQVETVDLEETEETAMVDHQAHMEHQVREVLQATEVVLLVVHTFHLVKEEAKEVLEELVVHHLVLMVHQELVAKAVSVEAHRQAHMELLEAVVKEGSEVLASHPITSSDPLFPTWSTKAASSLEGVTPHHHTVDMMMQLPGLVQYQPPSA
ncbi:hypothetical protein J6590_080089 [Homalodisca vitripennis]|nr:hypothetical protein J6590_080089 [Homalodisca vitripennis]